MAEMAIDKETFWNAVVVAAVAAAIAALRNFFGWAASSAVEQNNSTMLAGVADIVDNAIRPITENIIALEERLEDTRAMMRKLASDQQARDYDTRLTIAAMASRLEDHGKAIRALEGKCPLLKERPQ